MTKTRKRILGWSRSTLLTSVAASISLTSAPQMAQAQGVPPATTTIAGSVCGVTAGTTTAFGNDGIRWEHNDPATPGGPAGASPDASVRNTDLFASATPAVPTNITAQINGFDYNLDTRTIPSAQTTTDYFEYTFTTANFPELGEVNGVAFAGFAFGDPADNQASGQYRFSIQIDTDTDFSDADTLMSNVQVDDGDFPGADDVFGPQDFGSSLFRIGHYDANVSAVELQPNTTYIMRVFFFDAARSGADAGTPFPGNVVLWDDFFLKGTNCEEPTAVDDAETGVPAGQVATFDASNMEGILENDSANGPSGIDQATVTLIPPVGATTSGTVTDAAGDVVGFTVNGQGTWAYSDTTGDLAFTPVPGLVGDPTPITYTVDDGIGLTSDPATIRVSYSTGIVANPDSVAVLETSAAQTGVINVLGNDRLAGATPTDADVEVSVASGSALPTGLTLNTDGSIDIAAGTPSGRLSFDYTICELDAGAPTTNCSTASVDVIIIGAGSGLIPEIEEDLLAILSEDLANTLTTQSNQISGYSADALDRLRGRDGNSCLVSVNARLEEQNIVFATDRAVILPQSFATLDAIAAILIGCSQDVFKIAGHTDSDASDAYNLDLSQRRATAVRLALAERGVDTSGYIAQGYGESQPIATNATREGKAQNRRVEFLALDSGDSHDGPCEDSFSLVRAFTGSASDDGLDANGQFASDRHDCARDRRQVFEGTISHLDTDQGQTQSAINLSYRSETYRGNERVFGYFIGLYGSQSDVSRLANGEINGAGLNAGIYGANALRETLYIDYYLGAATGRHTFDLDFDRDFGTIASSGDYQYFAGFAGAALSGEVKLGETKLSPRIGIDYVYTPGADVDVVARLSSLSDAGSLDVDAISGGRMFAEVRADQLVRDGASNLWISPRIACYQSLGSLDGTCGFGGSIGLESASEDSDLSYALELSGEWGDGYSQTSLSMRATRQMGIGTLSGDAGVTQNGSGTLSGLYEVQF